jgi:hypothetical protein
MMTEKPPISHTPLPQVVYDDFKHRLHPHPIFPFDKNRRVTVQGPMSPFDKEEKRTQVGRKHWNRGEPFVSANSRFVFLPW